MIRAIAWKEFREQGLIALTLVVLGGGLLAAAASLADPPAPGAAPSDVIRFLGIGRLATLMLAVTAGMVCGGAVFAAEREAATFTFLDSLPASRWHIWRAKVLAGLALAFVQIALLVLIAAALGMVSNFGWAVAVIVYSLLAFVWGVFGSTTARTTLGSVGIAIPAASLTAFFVLIPVTLYFQGPSSNLPRMSGALVFLACMFAFPLILSAWLFTGLDRTRAAEEPTRISLRSILPAALPVPSKDLETRSRQHASRRSRFGLLALLWLAGRQLLVPGLVVSLFAFLFGLVLLLPPAQPFIAWPALALTAGVVAGVTAFADEQTHGAARYWGEQRLPTGRLWLVKITLHLLFCAWLLALLALPMVVRTQFPDAERQMRGNTFFATAFRSPLFDQLGSQGWKYLLLPAVYGFAAGHICGLVFRKLVVACGVAGIVGSVATALWGPSVLSGGVKHWQVWLPAAALLATGVFLIRAWVSERIPTRAGIIRIAAGAGATVLILAAGIGYRVLEISLRDGSEDDIAYVNTLPNIDQNIGGREFKAAAERFNRLTSVINPRFDHNDPASPGSRRDRVEERADRVLRNGWPDHDPELNEWLNALFDTPAAEGEETWHATAAKAAAFPIGIYEDPRLLAVSGTSPPSLEHARRMAVALLVRGLQQQDANPVEFPQRLNVVLTLGQTLQRGSIIGSLVAGIDIERAGLLALDRWLERLPNDSTRIRPLIKLVQRTEPTAPFDPTPHFLAERHVLREGMKTPSQWLPQLLATPGKGPDDTLMEVDLVGLAWAVPWERERTRRIIAMGFESSLPTTLATVVGRPGLGLIIARMRIPRDLIELNRLMTSHRRATILKLAIRAYRAEKGQYPAALDELEAAGYFRESPRDPFGTNRPFGYRLARSTGELLINPARVGTDRNGRIGTGGQGAVESQRVPPGQPIIWSIGTDGIDQDGRNLPAGLLAGQARPADLVYLVPLAREKAEN